MQANRLEQEQPQEPKTLVPASWLLREGGDRRPDGLMLVDSRGVVDYADQGAIEILGPELVGSALGAVAPQTGLAAYVLDGRGRHRTPFRFDRSARRGSPLRSVDATVLDLVGPEGRPIRAVMLNEAAKARMVAEVQGPRGTRLVEQEHTELLAASRSACMPGAFLGRSAAARSVRARLAEVARRGRSAFIQGERGTGWSLAARILHYAGDLRGPLLRLRCANLSPESIDRELFGWDGGAFAGAEPDAPGLLHLARGGTLYLEGLETLTPELQERLLDALRSGSAARLGGRRREPCVQRLLTASPLAPDDLVAAGAHPDLVEWLVAETIHLSPLRENPEDLADLVPHFLSRFGITRAVKRIAADAMATVTHYDWPGNTAELADCIERACSRASEGCIQVEDLARPLRLAAQGLPPAVLDAARKLELPPAGALPSAGSGPAPHLHAWQISEDDPISLQLFEKKAIMRALEHCDGDRLKAAKLLGVGKSTIYRKLKEYDIH